SSIDINSEIVYGALAPQQYIKKDAWQILGGDVSSSLKINTADVLNSTDVDPWFHLDFKDSNVNLRTEIGRVRSIDVTD
ncbi:MAG: hypothetical protein GWN01_12275, partial [Nitrosopumilaceae archaeon]|nr:hypothetical protein [Nitrosopumilaceae archaeon]NIU88363.1 hypothetical protein [Nitrosopumilaceae archaeon]NIV66648.1 hypothetical protein [Nitrosopumilaceae archaeon]NIX62253.1 hypothetical protein [Nitrosopumilaceae archaeon]